MRSAATLPGVTHRRVLTGSTVDALTAAIGEWSITDIVMTNHGRTGLARVMLRSVADTLIYRLHCPIIVIPPLAMVAAQ